MEKRDFAGLELGPPDISIRNMQARTYIVVVLFLGGRGVGGWVLRVRPTHATTPTGLCFCLCVHDIWDQQVAGPHVSDPKAVAFKAPKQRPPRHDPGLPGAPTFEKQTNLLSFANESVCITMPVFSLQ